MRSWVLCLLVLCLMVLTSAGICVCLSSLLRGSARAGPPAGPHLTPRRSDVCLRRPGAFGTVGRGWSPWPRSSVLGRCRPSVDPYAARLVARRVGTLVGVGGWLLDRRPLRCAPRRSARPLWVVTGGLSDTPSDRARRRPVRSWGVRRGRGRSARRGCPRRPSDR